MLNRSTRRWREIASEVALHGVMGIALVCVLPKRGVHVEDSELIVNDTQRTCRKRTGASGSAVSRGKRSSGNPSMVQSDEKTNLKWDRH
jgi:hypothetical protein